LDETNQMDLTSCDLEPIHIPGSIQPHGIMLISDPRSGQVVGCAGELADPSEILGRTLEELVGIDCQVVQDSLPGTGIQVLGELVFANSSWDAVAYASGAHIIVELTGKADGHTPDGAFLAELDALEAQLDRATSLLDLANEASRVFQRLTGYGRVMVYRFVDDEAGVVVGESIADNSPSFMRHHFPATDIPKQARDLYVRNKVRVIADVHYQPSPVVSASSDLQTIDMSDSTIRSVSPVHIQYLKNMGVAASASMSIVKDGILWGLVACHHHQPRPLPLNIRLACQNMASNLARVIKAREDSELYRERIALRAQEDRILRLVGEDRNLSQFFARTGRDLAELLNAHGFAVLQGDKLVQFGSCPPTDDIHAISDYVRAISSSQPVVTRQLSAKFPPAMAFKDKASGLIAVKMATDVPTVLMWFRAEVLQTIKWAGNPHKEGAKDPNTVLTPRASFDEWSEQVSGKSEDWNLAQIESAGRVVRSLHEARNNSRIRLLNSELSRSLNDNVSLMQQKDVLLREVNHRVQNSLSLVATFLRMQGRGASQEVKSSLEQAEHRLMAVSLAHRRLYQDDSVEIIDLSRYIGELVAELLATMDSEWGSHLHLDLAPVLIKTDDAVTVGLVVNELFTNLAKYAYDGRPGSATIKIEQIRSNLRVTISDSGKGISGPVNGTGFGTRMLSALVSNLKGSIEFEDNSPGTRAVVVAPIQSRGYEA